MGNIRDAVFGERGSSAAAKADEGRRYSLLQIALMDIIIVVFVRCGTRRAVFISFA
jgi:hypothetical protein